MSTTETTEQTALLCPGCAGLLEATQTICAACRAALEEQVLAVRAADYPALFHNVVRNSGAPHRSAIDPTSMDMLKVAENTSDDIDLVPLVPMDDVRRTAAGENGGASESNSSASASAPAPTMAAASGSIGSSAIDTAIPLAVAPSPVATHSSASRPGQTVYTPTAPKLEPSSSYKHVLIAIVCLGAAAALAAVLWSTLVPNREADADKLVVPAPANVRTQAK